jgi:hypothetical protein
VTIAVNTPDGGVANFPDGTPTDTITAAMRSKFGGPGSSSSPASSGSGSGLLSTLTSPTFAGESYTQEAKDLGLSAADYLALGQLKHIVPDSIGNSIAQAHQNLGLADYGVGAGAYLLGPGKILGPAAKLAGMGGVSTAALEGAAAGGISGFDPSAPVSSTLEGAAGGAALGGVGGGLGKAANTVAESAINTKLGQSAMNAIGKGGGTADEAVAQTAATSRGLYDQLGQVSIQPARVDSTLGATMDSFAPDLRTGLSQGLKYQLGDIRQELSTQQTLGQPINASIVDRFRQQLEDAGSNKADRVAASQFADSLNNLVAQHGAGDLLTQAQAAAKQAKAAQALQGWQTDLTKYGASPGEAPITQQKYYDPSTEQPQIGALDQIYNAGAQKSGGLGYLAGRAGGELAEGAMAASGAGGLLTMGAGIAGHLLKYPIQGLSNVYKRANLANQLRRGYQPLTGQSVGTAAPNIGEAIKGLTLSQGSQYGY